MSYKPQDYPGVREYICNGSPVDGHSSRIMVYAYVRGEDDEGPDDRGAIQIEICADPCCAKIVTARCDHINCSWNEEKTVLNCNFCGIDAT